MCEISEQLKFCTCIEESDLEKINILDRLDKFQANQLFNNEDPFYWILYEYKGKIDSGCMGIMFMPGSLLKNQLTEDFVLDELNNRQCFDFEYTPLEGDYLKVCHEKNQYTTEYLSFIYRNNKWQADFYNIFDSILEPKNYGDLKVRNQ